MAIMHADICSNFHAWAKRRYNKEMDDADRSGVFLLTGTPIPYTPLSCTTIFFTSIQPSLELDLTSIALSIKLTP